MKLSTTSPERDYREGFWRAHERLGALTYGAESAYDVDPRRALEIIAEVGREALIEFAMWLEPIADRYGYPTDGTCACGSERGSGHG